ncbi:MAG: antibiotic biosynthesis monooxygenase family protein [Nocardioides sp.]
MIVVTRYRVNDQDSSEGGVIEHAQGFGERLSAVAAIFAGKPGFLDATVARNVDEPDLWTLVTRWRNVGSYRRALSAYDVKLHAVPLLSQALDEPSAYEVYTGESELNRAELRSLD